MKGIRDRRRTVELDEFLSRPLFAHLATSSEQGPRDSPVWFSWEQQAVCIIASPATDTFPAPIEHEPRWAIGIVDFDRATGWSSTSACEGVPASSRSMPGAPTGFSRGTLAPIRQTGIRGSM